MANIAYFHKFEFCSFFCARFVMFYRAVVQMLIQKAKFEEIHFARQDVRKPIFF